MHHRYRRRIVAAVGAVAMAIVLAASAAGAAGCPDKIKCGKNQRLVLIDTKACRPNRQRPAVLVRRACCENARGKIRCQPFRKCPKRSASTACG